MPMRKERTTKRWSPFTDFRHDHADGVTPPLPKGPGEVVRPVIQFSGSRTDQFLSALGNRFCSGRSAEDKRDGRLRESQVFCEGLQTDALPGEFSGVRGHAGLRTGHRSVLMPSFAQ
jgi:hypothetical protein